jgi:hypothetical protein
MIKVGAVMEFGEMLLSPTIIAQSFSTPAGRDAHSSPILAVDLSSSNIATLSCSSGNRFPLIFFTHDFGFVYEAFQ